jgi:hypothetical protein
MRKLFFSLLLSLFAISANAQDRPTLTPQQKANVANGVMAVIVGPVFLPAAILTGNREGLCRLMGGTYSPTSADQCPNGIWLNLIPYIKGQKPK